MRSKETELEQAYSRLEAGEPPNEQAEREWEREVREERRRRVEAYTRRKVGTMGCTMWGSNPTAAMHPVLSINTPSKCEC